jgi:cytochrome c biogenesis protein CcdA
MILFPWLLFLHVLGAIIAFGPTFSSPIIGRMGAAEREHGNFAMRVSRELARIQILPLAIFQGITGLGLIVTANVDVMKANWLLVAIVLYLIAIGFAIFIQTPRAKRIIEMTTPPAGAPAGPAAGPPAGGPPPALMSEIVKVKRGGQLLIGLVVAIVFLMVMKPF